jgi:hypothetical protein
MWPLSIVLLIAAAGPQNAANADQAYIGKIPSLKDSLRARVELAQRRGTLAHGLTLKSEEFAPNTCFLIRSYNFQRHDGNAPVLAGMSTCTPARILEQKRVSPSRGLYVPLSLQPDDQKQPQ